MRLGAAGLGAIVLTSTVGLAGGAEVQSPPAGRASRPAPRAAAPVATTFDAVHDGKHAAGKAVEFPVVLLPETAIQNKLGAKTTYSLLAVRKDGPYLKALEALLAEAQGPGREMMRELPTVLADDQRYRQLIGGLDDLLQRALGREVGVEETVAVEVPGLAAVASAYDWETVRDPAAPSSLSSLLEAVKPFRSDYVTSIDAPKVRRELINMSLTRPPNLEQPLPQLNLSPGFKFTNQADLDNFNAAVDLYNAERVRRRGYVVERTRADFELALSRLELRLGQAEERLSATVIAPPPQAAGTFAKIYKGKAPAAFVRERGQPDASLVRRALATTAVQICSYPTGASVRLDGREVGTTPYLARSLPAASKLTVVVARDGAAPHQAVETVPLKPSGVKRFDYNLVAGQPRLLEADEAQRLFDPAFKPGRPFTLAITSQPFTPLPPVKKESKEQKKESKEQKKEREARNRAGAKLGEYVDSLRKSATDAGSALAPWFRLIDGGEAEVTVEVVAIEASERRSKYDSISTHRVRARLAGDPPGAEYVDDISPWIAKPSAPLVRVTERLKNERWPRALGLE